MDYINQLKEKYNGDLTKSYKEYILSKTLYRTMVLNKDCSDKLKEAEKLQQNLNNYCDSIINNSDKVTVKFHNDKNRGEQREFLEKNQELLNFLNIDSSKYVDLISGMEEIKLKKAASNITTWEQFESIVKEENNNVPQMNNIAFKEKLSQLCDKYGFESITYGNGRTTEISINDLENRLKQLKNVVDCQDKQIGLKKFNLHIDTEETVYAGYSACHNGYDKIYLNDRLAHDAFAHEWFHAIDSLVARYNNSDFELMSDDPNSSFYQLYEKSKIKEEESLKEIKEQIIKTSLNNINNIIERNSKSFVSKDKEKFKEDVVTIYQGILNGESPNLEKVQEISKKHMPESPAISSFIYTELKMLDRFKKENLNDLKNSFFYEYSCEIDKCFEKLGVMPEGVLYSSNNHEITARMFEAYVCEKLKEKKLDNSIAVHIIDWKPTKSENTQFSESWKPVIADMKKMMNDVLPPSIQIPNSSNLEKKMELLQSKLDKVSESAFAKIKI